MVWREVCNSVSRGTQTGRALRLSVALGLIILTSSTAYGQENLLSGSSSQVQSRSDSLTALFEDLYGRFPNAITSDLSYLHSESRYEPRTPYSGPNFNMNDEEADFMAGNRRTYQASADIRLNSFSQGPNSQFLNLGLAVRPDESWQLSGDGSYFNFNNGSSTEFGLSAVHLSGGETDFTETRLEHYFYFSNLLLNPGQIAFSFAPSFNSPNLRITGLRNYSFNVPLQVTYGLTDNIFAGASAYFDKTSMNSASTTSDASISLDEHAWEFRGGLNLGFLFDDNSLISLRVNWYTNNDYEANGQVFSNGYSYQSVQTAKESFGDYLMTWDMLSLNRSLSIYDLRRSYYNGRYLHSGETLNRLAVEVLTKGNATTLPLPSYILNQKTAFSDSVAVGISDLFQFNLKGVLANTISGYRSGDWQRYGIAQLTLHNLNFNGPELNDFDYLFGMILNPGDYSATASLLVSSENTLIGNMAEPTTLVELNARVGILKGVDAAFGYTYSKYGGPASSSSNMWSLDVRADIVRSLRLECSLGRGESEFPTSTVATSSNSLSVQTSLVALF